MSRKKKSTPESPSHTQGLEENIGRYILEFVLERAADTLLNTANLELPGLGTFSVIQEKSDVRNIQFAPSPELLDKLNRSAVSPRDQGKSHHRKIMEVVDDRPIMHATIELKIIHDDPVLIREAMDEVFQLFKEYEAKYNFYDPKSLLTSINREPEKTHTLIPEFYHILQTALMVSEKSDGAYDMTVGPVVKLWDFGSPNPVVPPHDKIVELLSQVGYKRITLRDGTVTMKPGTSIDLSGAVKGFAADAGCEILKKRGITNAMVNAGRNIKVIGKNLEGESWKIAIADPRAAGKIIAIIDMENEAVATSGDYERYFIQDGKLYHHILDPRTGYPISGCISVTIISKHAAFTDLLSTASFVMGPERAKKVLQELECEGVFVTESGIEYTPGLAGKLTIL